MPKDIPVVLIIGKQNVGKTTLIKLLIPRLKKKGYEVGTIKYNVPCFEIDYEGKDTYEYYRAGADVVSISSSKKLAVIKRINRKHPSIRDIIKQNYRGVDIVLVEGYKKWRYPYIEICKSNYRIQSTDKDYKHRLKITSIMKASSPIPVFHRIDLNNIIKFIELKIK